MPEKQFTFETDLPIKTVDSAAEVLGPPKEETPAWRKTLTVFLSGLWIVLCGFLSQFFQDNAEQIKTIIIALLPLTIKGYSGAVVGLVLGAITTWLKKRNSTVVLEEKRDALATMPPPDISKYYKKAE